MPQGLQIWDANGRLILDVTTRLTRVEGSVATGVANGSFQIPLSSGEPFIIVEDSSGVFSRFGPGVWLDGTVIRWEFSSSPWAPGPRASYNIKYGWF